VGGVEEALAAFEDAISRMADSALDAPADWVGITGVARLMRASHRVQALTSATAWKVDQSGICQQDRGIGLTSYLAATENLTRAQVSRVLLAGRDTAKLDVLRRAGVAGLVNPEQAKVVAKEFAGVPDVVGGEVLDEALGLVVGHAKHLDPPGLRVAAHRVVEHLAPDTAEERERLQVVAEERRAMEERSLRFHTSDGVVRFEGALPGERGRAFQLLVEANAKRIRADLAGAPVVPGVPVSGAQFLADGLSALVDQAARSGSAPANGGDRPRVNVTMSLTDLMTALDTARPGWDAGLGRCTAGTVRLLACDADIVPMVLGTGSEVLDVGREHRLVTPGIRRALELRDRGCVFPGCDRGPEACHAHHLVPWWAGGSTSVDNLVLLCPVHHPVVEPPHPPGATTVDQDWPDRWRIELDAQGIPVTIPPASHDPARAPMYHPRHQRAPWETDPAPDPEPEAPPEPPGETSAPPDSDTRT
jgi:hypothetical protein